MSHGEEKDGDEVWDLLDIPYKDLLFHSLKNFDLYWFFHLRDPPNAV